MSPASIDGRGELPVTGIFIGLTIVTVSVDSATFPEVSVT